MKSKAKKKTAGKKSFPKYLFILFFLAVLAVAALIIKPFLSTLIVSAILAYVLYPVYNYFFSLTKMKGFSAAILIILLLLLLSLPLVIVTGKLTSESYEVYTKAKQVFLDTDPFENACADDSGFICGTYNLAAATSAKYDLNLGFHFARGFSSIASVFVSKASDFILNIPKLLLHVFIGLFAMFYMFVDGKDMLKRLKQTLPLKAEHSDRMLKHFNDIIYATIYGAIVIAILQGIVAGIGYFIFGVSSPLLLGLLTLVAAFIPFLGAALVWLPVSISMLVSGILTNDSSLMLRAGGLVIYGALIVSTIDNFVRPKLVGDRAGVHPLLILLGVFGGMALFGFVGIMVGPLILTLFIALLSIYEQEKEHLM
jgi:predicted PurR-regulated permease PerM